MKLDILLPTNLSEIPLSRYQEFIAMKEKSNDEEFIAQKMIQIFCGMKLGEVAKIKMKHLNELIAHFTKVFSEKPQLIRKFKIKNIEFGFIPKFDDISFGEYVDLENYMKDWKTYHKALSVMYRPIKNTNKDKYEIVNYEPNEDMQDLMKFAPLDVAISSSFFLSSLGIELLKATQTYLQKELKKMKKDLTNSAKDTNLVKTGVGMGVSMDWLTETLQSLMKSQSTSLLNVLPISPSKNKNTKSKPENLNNK
eukprot:COSAG01_NODE_2813_length_7029_cov_5.326263_11_plen_252_part_00